MKTAEHMLQIVRGRLKVLGAQLDSLDKRIANARNDGDYCAWHDARRLKTAEYEQVENILAYMEGD